MHKLTTEQLAKIIAIQVWGVSQQTGAPMTYNTLLVFEEFYKKEFKRGNVLGKTLEQYEAIRKIELSKKEE